MRLKKVRVLDLVEYQAGGDDVEWGEEFSQTSSDETIEEDEDF
jgi:hypothetical protein